MMPLKRKIFLSAILLCSLLCPNCENQEETDHDCGSAICTQIFMSVVVNLKHATDNSPYLLSNYSVVRLSDNADITPTADSYSTSHGYYPIANDSKLELFKFKNLVIEFKGYLNSNLVIQRQYVITADCCHISLVQGETSISL
jgi:hypothetical protein